MLGTGNVSGSSLDFFLLLFRLFTNMHFSRSLFATVALTLSTLVSGAAISGRQNPAAGSFVVKYKDGAAASSRRLAVATTETFSGELLSGFSGEFLLVHITHRQPNLTRPLSRAYSQTPTSSLFPLKPLLKLLLSRTTLLGDCNVSAPTMS